MKRALGLFAIPVLLATAAFNVLANDRDDRGLHVAFHDCTEFVGIAAVDVVKARALVPADYQIVTDDAGAKLVIRISNCQGIAVNHRPAHAGTLAHIGIMIYSPDGTATDPNTSINNYTLTYASNVADLVKALAKQGVSTTLDINLAYEVSPDTGSSEMSRPMLLTTSVGSCMALSPIHKYRASFWRTGGSCQKRVRLRCQLRSR